MAVKKPSRRFPKFLTFALLGLTAVVLFLKTDYAADTACNVVRRQLPALLNLDLGVNRCSIDPLTQTVTLRGISAFEPGATEALFTAESLEVSLRAIKPQSASIELGQLKLNKPRIRVDLTQPPKPGKPPSENAACPVSALRRAEIRNLEIKDASVKLILPNHGQVDVSGVDLGWTLRRGGADFQLDARAGTVVLGPNRSMALTKLSAEGTLDPDDELLELTRAEVGLDDATVSVNGKIEQLCKPALALNAQLFLPLATIVRAAGAKLPASGHLWSRVAIGGKATAPTAQLELVASHLAIGAAAPGDFSLHVTANRDQVVLDRFDVNIGPGKARISGRLGLTGNMPITAKLDTENAEFAEILIRAGFPAVWVDFFATAKGNFTGSVLPKFSLQGDADVRGSKFLLASRNYKAPPETGTNILAFAQGHALVHAGFYPDRVELTNIRVTSGGTHAIGDVILNFDESKGISIKGKALNLELSDFGSLAELPWKGQGSGEFEIGGPYADVQVDARFSLRDFELWGFGLGVAEGHLSLQGDTLSFPSFSGQKGKTAYTGRASLFFGPEDVKMGLHAQVRNGRTQDLIDLIAGLSPTADALRGSLFGDASGNVDLDGWMKHMNGAVRLNLANTAYYGRHVGDGPLTLRFVNGESMVLDKTTLNGPLGALSAQGSFSFEGPLDFKFRLDRGSLAELLVPDDKSMGVGGVFTLVGTVDGDSTTPVVNAYMTAPNVGFAKRALGAMHLEGRLDGRNWQLFGRPFDDARITSKGSLAAPYPYEGTLSFTLPEIRPLLPVAAINQGVSGSLAGEVQVAGAIDDPTALHGKALIKQLALARGDFNGHNEGPISLSYEKQTLKVDPFSIRGSNTELAGEGMWSPSRVDANIHGTFDVRLLESVLPIERSGGRIEISARATGSSKDPSLVGMAELVEARGSWKDEPVTVRALSGHVEFSEARILVQDMLGVLNDGKLSVRGDMRIAKLGLQQVELGVDLEDVAVKLIPDLPMTMTGSLMLLGKGGQYTLSGGMDILKMRYDRPLVLESFLKDVKQRRWSPVGEKPKEWLRFDVDVDASGDLRIDNNIARARIGGKVKLTGTNARPGMLGTLELLEGGQAFFRGNIFTIYKGELQFKNMYAFDPWVDLNARTQARDYLVTLKALGPISEPKVFFSSDPSLSEPDIISLLTLGWTAKDKSVSSEAGLGLGAEALLSASGLDQQVQRFLPKNAVLRDLQMHVSTTYNEVSGLVEPAWNLESKLLTDQLKLGMTQPVFGRGTRAYAEYRFNNRISAKFQWDNERQDYTFGNPGLDLKLRFDLE